MAASRNVSIPDGKDSEPISDMGNHAAQQNKDGPASLVHGESLGIDEASRLEGLATEVRDQDDLERDINRQVRCRMQYVETNPLTVIMVSRPINY